MTNMSDRQTERDPIPPKTLIVPCKTLKPGASLGWLVAGWADLIQAKRISLIYGLLIFGFLAGFSETLIPNALRNLEERANNESNH